MANLLLRTYVVSGGLGERLSVIVTSRREIIIHLFRYEKGEYPGIPGRLKVMVRLSPWKGREIPWYLRCSYPWQAFCFIRDLLVYFVVQVSTFRLFLGSHCGCCRTVENCHPLIKSLVCGGR